MRIVFVANLGRFLQDALCFETCGRDVFPFGGYLIEAMVSPAVGLAVVVFFLAGMCETRVFEG